MSATEQMQVPDEPHGPRRTNADKRADVAAMMLHPEWSKLSNREIARRCGVTPALTNAMRKEFTRSNSIER
jgi:hypothetical protein